MFKFKIVVEGSPDVPGNVIEAVRKLAESGQLGHRSFPNGSSYDKWVIPLRQPVQVGDATAELRYNQGICVEDSTRYYRVEEKEILGAGADFGAYFFNRDQTGLKINIETRSMK